MNTARDLCTFIDASPTPFHAVAEASRRLLALGYERLDESSAFGFLSGQRAFLTRGDSSLIAFHAGSTHPTEAGFRMIGAHTDSPNLRLKPRPARAKEGYLLFDVDVYGGVLLATWADRDLGVAGRLIVEEDGRLTPRFVRIDRPICRVANLAIHLNREVNDKGLVLNKHQHLGPILGESLGEIGPTGDPEARVLELLSSAAGVSPESIRGLDIALFDLLPSTVGGLSDEFIFAPRLDNLAMSHAALGALTAAKPEKCTALIALFDHEEVGSSTARGADGPFLEDVLNRLCGDSAQARARALTRSVLVSADMAHAVHPHYADLHDRGHMPLLNAGPVVKTNYNQRYATDGESAAIFRSVCRALDVPCQEFVNRPDLACGSTIGPISASRLGVRTVDVGNAMLSMHSIREMTGSRDPGTMTRVMTAFLEGLR